MKKILLTATVLGLLIGFTTVSTSEAVVNSNDERGFVTVSASANKELTPDVAEINFAIQTSDSKSMQKAAALNKETSDKVYAALKSMINTANGDYVKTADFNASPVYSYSGSKRSFDKYEVSNSIIVHTKSIDKVGKMIDKAVELGATNVNNLSFSVSKYETECDEIMALATQKAQRQAANLAISASTSITGVKSLNGSCSPSNNTRVTYNLMRAGAAADAEASSTPIETGVVRIYANVTASFFVK